MLAEVATVISVMKGLNDAIATLKETGGHASGLAGVMEKYARANESVQIAKKQLQTFNQQLKDMMLMQGLSADYNEIMQRVEDSRLAHEKELKRKRLLRKQRIEFAKTFGLIFGTAFIGFILIMGTILIVF